MRTIHYLLQQAKLAIGFLLLFLLAAGVLLSDTMPAYADTFTVPCTGNAANDGAALSAAVASANSNGQADTLNLAAGCTYQLSTALHFAADGAAC